MRIFNEFQNSVYMFWIPHLVLSYKTNGIKNRVRNEEEEPIFVIFEKCA